MERLTNRISTGGSGFQDWPPASVKERWLKIEHYRRRFDNDAKELFRYNPDLSGSTDQARIYTPVPLAREIARLSSALLFSEAPKITHDSYQESLETLLEANGMDPFLQSSGEKVAIEGRGAFRVIRDETVSDEPLITYVHEDQLLWTEKHGRFVQGGTVVIERDLGQGQVYRLLEEHVVGEVVRRLFRGDIYRLGTEVPLNGEEAKTKVPEFADLEADEVTGLDVPTLIRWDNVPGGHSDIAGIETLLDRLDEAESLLLDKGRKSVPIVFADESMVDAQGNAVSFPGVVFLQTPGVMQEGGMNQAVVTIQPGFDTTPHLEWIGHLLETSLMHSGYSLASYGLDQGGSADSGKALKLRQSRTLLTKAGKDRMAKEAIVNALAIALAWKEGASEVKDYRPDVVLGDGLPEDEIEDSSVIVSLDSAGAISLGEKVRRANPGWDQDRIDEEVAAIESAKQAEADAEAKRAAQSAMNSPSPFGE